MSDITALCCPTCGAANRVPTERLADKPNCGRCHKALFTGTPLTLDESGFERLASTEALPLLIDFWAPWCGPCRQMAPAFVEAALSLEPYLRLAKVDTEAVPSLGARFGIRSIPTLMLLRGGQETARRAGASNTTSIVQWARAEVEKMPA